MYPKGTLIGITFLLLPFTSKVNGDGELKSGGSVRLRYESKQDFDLLDSSQTYLLSQFRFNLSWKANENLDLFMELQDSRVFGESLSGFPSVNENVRNQPFADNLDIHQFYWKYKQNNLSLKFGRPKFNLGDKRLVASLEWANTARVHDGIRATYTPSDKRSIDFFISRLVSVDPMKLNGQSFSNNRYFDSEFHGAYVTDKETSSETALHYWWFYRSNSDFNDKVHTLGIRSITPFGAWTFDAQGGLQTGEFSGLDHVAGYLSLHLTRQLDSASLSFGYNYATGDDDPTDNEHQTFDNLYPLNHAYYGFMDLFSLQNIHNLEVIYKTNIGKTYGLRIAWQNFWLDETNDAWYNAGLGPSVARRATAIAAANVNSYVGSGVDFSVSKAYMADKLKTMIGVSFFEPGAYAKDTGNDEGALFSYLQIKYFF